MFKIIAKFEICKNNNNIIILLDRAQAIKFVS